MKKLLTITSLFFILLACTAKEASFTDDTSDKTSIISSKNNLRDWTQQPAIADISSNQDIIALGDVHGDYDNLVKLLKASKIIADVTPEPAKAIWTGGKSVLVCTGDMIDKWKNSLKVITLLQVLRKQSNDSAGQLIITMGNHEAEFLANPNNDKAVDFVTELKAMNINPTDVASGQHPVGKFLRSLPFAARIGKWFFCHSGNTNGKTFSELNSNLQTQVDKDGFGASILSDPNSILEARMHPSPWWEGVSNNPENTLANYTKNLGVEHIVMGHQPGDVNFSDGSVRKAGSMYQKFGRVFMIDVGMSQGVDNNLGAVLKIHSDGTKTSATAIYSDGHQNILWSN